MKRIPVAQPNLSGNERKYVLDCLDTNWISSNGKYIVAFEEKFAEYCNVEHAIATNNGTTALHLALLGLGLEPGEEVIIPTVTYIATANAVTYCGAKAVLCDVTPSTLNIDPEDVQRKITKKTRGIIAVHLYGHPADMQAINQVARDNNLWVLEDAAEAHGARANGKPVGSLGSCATFSFFGNKIITTGEGGMVTTNDKELATRLRLFRGQGMDPDRRYWFPVVGYNYRMTNVQAAIGLAQLEGIEQALDKRRKIAEWYNSAFEDLQGVISLPIEEIWADQVFWMYNVFLRDAGERERDDLMRKLDERGIETRPVFYPMHVMPPYFQTSSFPVADNWAARGINLPTYQDLTRDDVLRVVESIREVLSAR